MEFDLDRDVGSNNWLSEDVGEVGCELNWVDSFHVSVCELGKFAERIEVALFSDDGDDVDGYTFLHCELTDLLVELFYLSDLLLIFGFIEST